MPHPTDTKSLVDEKDLTLVDASTDKIINLACYRDAVFLSGLHKAATGKSSFWGFYRACLEAEQEVISTGTEDNGIGRKDKVQYKGSKGRKKNIRAH